MLGVPIKGHVTAARAGHASNVEFVKKLKKHYSKELKALKRNKIMNQFKSQTKFDINDIIKVLPHRYPFILIDRIEITEPGERLIALKNMTINEPFFQGHFPGQPVMPGVLSLEIMAQAGSFLMLSQVEDPFLLICFFQQWKKQN